MTEYFIIPGLGNSGPEHWQTWLEKQGSNFHRIDQEEWEAPVCSDWLDHIDSALEGKDLSNIVLIGHSLGCSTIAHWAKRSGKVVKGAMLVGPSDIEAPVYTFDAKGFAPIPLDRIRFPTIVVASTNDVWVSLERATYFAAQWGSELVDVGEAGHINAISGYGQWPAGLQILSRLG